MAYVLFVSNWFDVAGGTEVLSEAVGHLLSRRQCNIVHVACSKHVKEPLVRTVSPRLTKIAVPLPHPKGQNTAWQRSHIYDFVQQFLEDRRIELAAVHFFHFTNVGFNISNIQNVKNVIVTFTDYSLVCADFQYFVRHERRICSETETTGCTRCTGLTHAVIDEARRQNLRRFCTAEWKVTYQTPYQRAVHESFGLLSESCIADLGCYPSSLRTRTPPGVSLSRRSSKLRFVYFGRLSLEKGLKTVIDAFSILAGAEVELHAYLLDIHHPANILPHSRKNNIFFHRAVPYESVVSVMRRYDYLVVPSIWLENYPIVSSQAREAGLGIVASDVPSLKKIPDFKHAHWAPAGKALGWARVIKQLSARPKVTGQEPAALRATRQRRRFLEYVRRFEESYQPIET